MSQNSKIEWTHASWNPISGCDYISSGCQNCYAKRMARRLKGRFGYPKHDPFRVTIHKDKFNEPYKWKQPRMIFVCSMGDLFHKAIDFNTINEIFSIMQDNSQHIYQILTKRPVRLLTWLQSSQYYIPDYIWMGITCENQHIAEVRLPLFASIPSKVQFVSFEPLLSSINIEYLYKYVNWIIVGGETGPKSRRMDIKWAISLQQQAHHFNIPFFFKSIGDWYIQNNSVVNKTNFDRNFPLNITHTIL